MSRFAPPKRTAVDHKRDYDRWLYECRPHMLAAATVDELVARYALDRKVIECALIVARQKRAGEVV